MNCKSAHCECNQQARAACDDRLTAATSKCGSKFYKNEVCRRLCRATQTREELEHASELC